MILAKTDISWHIWEWMVNSRIWRNWSTCYSNHDTTYYVPVIACQSVWFGLPSQRWLVMTLCREDGNIWVRPLSPVAKFSSGLENTVCLHQKWWYLFESISISMSKLIQLIHNSIFIHVASIAHDNVTDEQPYQLIIICHIIYNK